MKIGFFWHSLTTGNLGVGALSIANMVLVERIVKGMSQDVEYVIFGPKGRSGSIIIPEIPKYRYVSLSAEKIAPLSLLRLLKDINSCDLILDIGSGDSFSDIYGLKRFAKILVSKLLVRKSARKLILSPQTIGPFKNPIYKKLASFVMTNAAQVYARDEISYLYAKEISGKKINLKLATDVAMLLPVRQGVHNELDKTDNNIKNVGINVSGLLYSGGYTGHNQFGLVSNYADMILEMTHAFSNLPGVQVWLVPHVLATDGMKSEDDYAACHSVSEKVNGVKLAPRFEDPIEAKSFIAELDFFVGARMHATIAAFSTGVPVIPLAYSRKFSGLFGSLNYNRVVDLTKCNEETVIEITLKAFHERETLRNELLYAYKEAEVRLKVYTNDLARRLSDIINTPKS